MRWPLGRVMFGGSGLFVMWYDRIFLWPWATCWSCFALLPGGIPTIIFLFGYNSLINVTAGTRSLSPDINRKVSHVSACACLSNWTAIFTSVCFSSYRENTLWHLVQRIFLRWNSPKITSAPAQLRAEIYSLWHLAFSSDQGTIVVKNTRCSK